MKRTITVLSLSTALLLSTGLMSGTAVADQQCGARVAVTGIAATGAIFKLKKNRAERRGKRAWRAFVAGENGPSIFSGFVDTSHAAFGLGTRYADLDNAKNVVINCKGGGKMRCTVTATPCTAK